MLRPGRGLCDRWLSAISLVLYGVQFESDLKGAYLRIAQSFLLERSQDELAWIIADIERELDSPSQQIRDILALSHEEDDLRNFLRLLVDYWRSSLVSQLKGAPMTEEKIISNQETIMANQETIISNQEKILGNQKQLNSILENQERILANQKSIMAKLDKALEG